MPNPWRAGETPDARRGVTATRRSSPTRAVKNLKFARARDDAKMDARASTIAFDV
jgi:hypothetical protein